MKLTLLSVIFSSLVVVGFSKDKSSGKHNVVQILKDEFWKNGLPRLSYYDTAQLIDDAQNFYEDLKTNLQLTKLEETTRNEIGKDLITSGLQVVVALQSLYTKSLTAFDKVLEVLVKTREEQKNSSVFNGETFMGLYKAIAEMDAEESDTFGGALGEFFTSLSKLNKDIVKSSYKLAKKRKDLRAIMDVHENSAADLKNICLKYAKLANLSTETQEFLSDISEPTVTFIVLGSLYGL